MMNSLRYVIVFIGVMAGVLMIPSHVSAQESDVVQIRPLLYRETLEAGQSKRGVVDISNGSTNSEVLDLTVRLFRQIGDDGSLEFYDNTEVTDGIKLEVESIELGPKEAARIGFSVDSTKLPGGDIFAVILATAKPAATPQAIVSAAQIGTLVILQNGQTGPRDASIEDFRVATWQTGDSVKATIRIGNPADAKRSTGFFPAMKASVTPWGATTSFEGPLVYAGRSRSFDFSVPSSQFGIYKLTVTANGTTASRYVFLVTGKWQLLAPLIAVALLAICLVGYVIVRRKRRKKQSKRVD